MEFLSITPGMSVIDVIAAGGYYTEVLSLAVGSEGHVIAQNPAMAPTKKPLVCNLPMTVCRMSRV